VHGRAPGHVEDQADLTAEIDGAEVDDRADAAAVEISGSYRESLARHRPNEALRCAGRSSRDERDSCTLMFTVPAFILIPPQGRRPP